MSIIKQWCEIRSAETRLVRGVVSEEERKLAYVTKPTDPCGPMPQGDKIMTVRALLYDGALIPGFAPGYIQRKPSKPEVLDEDSLLHWEWESGEKNNAGVDLGTWGWNIFRLGDKRIRVKADVSGSVVYVQEEVSCAPSPPI